MNRVSTAAGGDLLIAPCTDPVAWDAFVERTPGATFAHYAGWREVIERVMRHRTSHLCAWDPDGNIRGLLPLVRVQSLLFGVRFVSVAFLNDGGPIGEPAAVAALIEHAHALARDEGGSLELRTRAPIPGIEAHSRKVTVLLPLPSDAGTLWSSLPSKVRSQVRRPQKAGMQARFGPDQLDPFYDVWSRNMRDLGTPVLPRSFFEIAARVFPRTFVVGCVYSGSTPVAAGAGFIFRDELEITWASALREYSRDAPNMLLYWEFMTAAIERGARTFNFGRCTPGSGTHRFKQQWGGETVPLPWITSFWS